MGEGSWFACVEQLNLLFEQLSPSVLWSRNLKVGKGCMCTLHAFCHFVQTHPNLALLEVFWAGVEGKKGENLS